MKILLICVIALYSLGSISASAQTISLTPASSSGNDGKITIGSGNYTNGTSYSISYTYTKGGVVQTTPTINIPADAQGNIIIQNLDTGSYSDISINSHIITPALTYNIVHGNIAKNSWQAFASYYSNFSGLVDDNSTSFNQIYVRASLPLSPASGIGYDAKFLDRLIWFRNIFLQADYAININSLPCYYDSTNLSLNPQNPIRYVNRLDLIKYEKEEFLFNFNILTYILPEHGHSGDLGHLYLDFTTGIIGTDVTDSTFGTPFFTKSAKLGLNLKYRAEDIYITNHQLGFELSTEIFKINPIDNNFNPDLNPQYNDRTQTILSNSINSSKHLTLPSEAYIHPDLLIYYYTGNSNDSVSSSNVFLHLSFYSNFASASTLHFANNYFQIQVGYAMSIKKLLNDN